jgi:hypothetical protein
MGNLRRFPSILLLEPGAHCHSAAQGKVLFLGYFIAFSLLLKISLPVMLYSVGRSKGRLHRRHLLFWGNDGWCPVICLDVGGGEGRSFLDALLWRGC